MKAYKKGGVVTDAKTKKKVGLVKNKSTAQSDTLERSPEQVRENAGNQALYRRPKLSFEKRQAEAVKDRARNKQINKNRDARGRDKRGVKRLDETNLRDKDGSPLSGGSKAPILATKKIATKTPSKALKKSKAVIPVPSKKEVRGSRRRNRK